jgi:voltage-gated potassium channel
VKIAAEEREAANGSGSVSDEARLAKDAQRADPAPAYQLFMLGLCLYVLGALAVDAAAPLGLETREILLYADTGICIIFFADFVASFVRAERKLEYLAKWGWIDLLSSIPMIDPLRVGRAARVLRILRVLRAVKSTRILVSFILARRAEGAFAAAALTSILLIVFSSIAILEFEAASEEANIHTAGDALWWAFATITTVGYGDRFPVTMEGRIVACALMTAGVGLIGTFTGLLASWFLDSKRQADGAEASEIRDELAEIRRLLIEEHTNGRSSKRRPGSARSP